MSLSEKLEVLKQLDSEILNQIEEDDVAAEIESSDNFKEGIYAATVRVERALAPPPPPPSLG